MKTSATKFGTNQTCLGQSKLDSLPRNLGKYLKDSDAYVRLVLEGLSDSHTRIDYIDQRIRDELMPKLDRINEGSASGIENLTKIEP